MFCQRLNELRLKKGWSLDQLAQAVGSTKSYIWELEKKPDIKVSAELVTRISSALGVTVEDLMGVAPNDSDTVFFREYKSLDQPTKDQISILLQALKKRS